MQELKYYREGVRYNLITSEEENGIDIIASFIYWSVNNNRLCVYYSDIPFHEELKSTLLYYGLDLDELIEKRGIVLGSSSEFYSEKSVPVRCFNILQMVKEAESRGHDGLSLIIDREASYHDGFKEDSFYEYEAAVNNLFKQHKVSGLSIYNIDKFGADTFFAITRLNPNFIFHIDSQVYVHNEDINLISPEESMQIVYSFLKRRERIRRQNKVYSFISHLSGELSYRKDENDIIETGLNSICRAAFAHYGFVVMINDGEFDIDNIAKYRVPEEIMNLHLKKDFVERYHRLNLDKSTDWMIYRVQDMDEDMKSVLERYNIFQAIVIPVKYNNDILGYMWLATQDRYISFEDTYEFLQRVCETIGKMVNEHRHYKKMQESLLQSRKIQALGEMAGGIAHEFNNILTPILGYIQIVKSRIDDPELLRYVDLIEDSAKDGSRIVQRVQDFSKNRRKINELVDLDKAILQSVEIIRPKWTLESQIKNKSININLDLNSKALVKGVATEVREIFVNLISNSVDAMPLGGNIYISSKLENSEIVVKIRDSGMGIDKEVRERIFEPFYTTKNERGNGLGLSIVYNIIREMDGIIEVESNYGNGAEFTIILPAKSGDLKKADEPTSKYDVESSRILVIDDQEPVANAVGEMIKSVGHKVTVSVEDKKAIEIFMQGDYDCVICDLAMPNYSGTQMAEMLKEIKPEVSFILMTGWPGKLKAKDLKYIDSIIQKPFSIEEINAAIVKAVKSK